MIGGCDRFHILGSYTVVIKKLELAIILKLRFAQKFDHLFSLSNFVAALFESHFNELVRN